MKTPNLNRAARAWGANPPDWVKALALACDKSSQGSVARELEVSAATVNQVLANSYKGRMDRVENRVRGQYMKETVGCPVLGEISKRDCQAHQARKFRGTNPLRVKLFQACKTCPNREDACSKTST